MANQTKKVAPTLDAKTQKGLEAETTVSGKIRYLIKAGHSKADVSRILGKRYQHVRNVLEGDKLAKAKSA